MRYEILSSPEGVMLRKINSRSFDTCILSRTIPLEEILYDLIPFLTGVKVGLHVPAYVQLQHPGSILRIDVSMPLSEQAQEEIIRTVEAL